ncbi:ATP-binding protein, partial [Candidatus Woesearchaeota archaeon]|nr:ATP-binding protein [Candidatus Woesearchaeota archaeon]
LVAPKARYVTGKGASLDYNEPLLIQKNKIIQTIPIGQFVDTHYVPDAEDFMIPLTEPVETLSLNKQTNKLEWKQIKYVYRHRTKEQLYKFTLETGRQISVTGDHSIFTLENGKVTIKPAKELQKNTCVLAPKIIPNNNPAYLLSTEAARLLGYYIAEGHTINKNGSYKIEFTVNKKEQNIIDDIKQCSLKVLATKPCVYQHSDNGARIVIYGKKAHVLFAFLIGNVLGKKAKEKSIPFCIINAQPEAQQAFIDAYIAGDAGVTKSRTLMSDLLYLFLQQNILASTQQREDTKQTVIRGRTIYSKGPRYDLKSPKKGKKYSYRYTFPPFDALPKQTITAFFKEAISSKYSRATFARAENKMLLNRLQAISTAPLFGASFRQIFGECTLEYVTEHPNFFQKQKIGRQIQISITDEGKIALEGLQQLQNLVNSDLGFVRIKDIEKVNSTSDFVYDVSVPETENFVGGFGGIICHNSGAGLSATVVKDEFLQGWSLEAGALVLANKGLCCIDEMDKMAKEDTWAMHEALEQQSVTISKANIQATLRCETTVLAAANPKFGRFDPYETIANQINLPPTLINRFDLIFPIKDLPETQKDEKMARFILNLHQHNTETPDVPTKLLRKYIAYARQRIEPKLTDGAIEELQEYYIKTRSSAAAQGVKAIPISARQLEGLVRLSEASAKLRLSDKVLKKDGKKAIELMDYCLRQVAFDEKTGTIDIDRIATEMPAAQRNKIVTLKEIIVELENKIGKTVPIEDIIRAASEKGMGESDVEELIQKLKKAGDVFEPRHGFISRI